MKTKRIIAGVALVVGSGMALHAAMAQVPGINRIDLQRHDLVTPGREAVQVIVELGEGVTAPRHTHPGGEIIYVLEGSLQYQIEDQPPYIVEKGNPLLTLVK